MRDRVDLGLLVIRLGLGLNMMAHGLPKMLGGPDKWAGLGGAMGFVGLDLGEGLRTAFGFLAAFAELGGGLFVALGFLFRPSLLLLIATMVVAAALHLGKGEGYTSASHAIEVGLVFLGLFVSGPGRFRIRLAKGGGGYWS
ncbi:MAG: DoxX family protein [Myxococcota bacterium]